MQVKIKNISENIIKTLDIHNDMGYNIITRTKTYPKRI